LVLWCTACPTTSMSSVAVPLRLGATDSGYGREAQVDRGKANTSEADPV
jgi:hypothetical protein